MFPPCFPTDSHIPSLKPRRETFLAVQGGLETADTRKEMGEPTDVLTALRAALRAPGSPPDFRREKILRRIRIAVGVLVGVSALTYLWVREGNGINFEGRIGDVCRSASTRMYREEFAPYEEKYGLGYEMAVFDAPRTKARLTLLEWHFALTERFRDRSVLPDSIREAIFSLDDLGTQDRARHHCRTAIESDLLPRFTSDGHRAES